MAPPFFSLLAALRQQDHAMQLCPLRSPEGAQIKHRLSSPAIQYIAEDKAQVTVQNIQHYENKGVKIIERHHLCRKPISY